MYISRQERSSWLSSSSWIGSHYVEILESRYLLSGIEEEKEVGVGFPGFELFIVNIYVFVLLHFEFFSLKKELELDKIYGGNGVPNLVSSDRLRPRTSSEISALRIDAINRNSPSSRGAIFHSRGLSCKIAAL